jgi:uncharacterized glyoxalase superfamily protein PhnB
MAVKPIPDGYHTATPYLVVEDVDQLIDFLKEAFDALETERIPGPDGSPTHAEVQIGDSRVMMGSARGERGPIPAMVYIYTEDCDAAYRRALKAGAESVMEPEDQFYGDRNAGVKGPQGNHWWIATHVEDVSRDELQRRAAEKAR